MSTSLSTTLRVIVRHGTATILTEDGRVESLTADGTADVREAVVAHAVRLAHECGHPVELTTSGDRGNHLLRVDPDGGVFAIDAPLEPDAVGEASSGAATRVHQRINRSEGPEQSGEAPTTSDGTEAKPDETEANTAEADTMDTSQTSHATAPLATTPQATSSSPASDEAERASFIDTTADDALIPSTGLRGWLRREGFRLRPTAQDRARYDRIRTVSAHWAGPRSIAVVNGKGGVGKTPTTAMLAAVFARYGGGTVLAFDNNDTRGTLGWRTEASRHDATISDLLTAVPQLVGAPTSAMAGYVHHQTDDRYDVLRSNPRVLSADQRLTTEEFDQLVSTILRGYRLVVFDSGNDEAADRWVRMVDWAGQLVVPTLASPESAESAALLLEALAARDERSAALAHNAVVVITHAEPTTAARTRAFVNTLTPLARAVVVIPFDTALKSGPLRFGMLRQATQQAWITAAAHAADQF